MSIHWHDLSIPIEPGMVVWPGDPEVEFSPKTRIAEGAGSNTSHIAMSTHTGTHVDAPWHFEDGGKRLDEVDPQVFFGDALLLDFPGLDIVRAPDLGPAPLPPRILIKTRNSELPINAPFDKTYVALHEDAAQRMVDEGVKLVGVDAFSVAPYKQPGQPTHHILLANDVFVIEGLRLAGFVQGIYPFVALPLPLKGLDGAPCRAFLGLPEPN